MLTGAVREGIQESDQLRSDNFGFFQHQHMSRARHKVQFGAGDMFLQGAGIVEWGHPVFFRGQDQGGDFDAWKLG